MSLLVLLPLLLSPLSSPPESSPVAEAAIAEASGALDRITEIPTEARTFDNTVRAVDDVLARLYAATLWTGFQANVHPDLEVRQLGETTRRAVSDYAIEVSLHEGVYRTLTEYAASGPALEGEDARLLDRLLLDARRAGMELPVEKREELKAIEFELNELEQEFSNNIRDDESALPFTREELAGCPQRFLDGLQRSDALYLVTMKTSDISPLFANCEVARTRQKVSLAYQRRAGTKNVALLEKILRLRSEKATLLGYPTIAHYVTEDRMARTPEEVWAFYTELRPKLRRKAEADHAELTAAKREHTGDPNAQLDSWDSSFYKNYLLRNRYSVDQNEVRKYFPLDAVYEGLFSITQELFGLEYRDVTASAADRGRPVWHADARLYEVVDSETGKVLGEFYTDLHPRPNKYNHAAQFPLVFRKAWADGSISRPVVALVCNFTKPTADEPSLLTHAEVKTFFHEFGHCLHSILTEANHATFAGTSVSRDFVEAPSQMLENWVWDADVLRTFTRHFETGEPLPEDVLDGMLRARFLRSGMDAEYQAWLGVMDMTFHTAPGGEIDTTASCFETRREFMLLPPTEGTHFQAAFGHLMGYHAGYYGYLWSLVYAQDMFGRFRELGILDPEAGRYYRDKILSRGGTEDALELVRSYLGREPSPDAFLEHLGLMNAGS